MEITLRPWTITDLETLVKYANNRNIAKNLTDGFPYPYTIEDGKTFLGIVSKDNPVKVFAIDKDGEAIGSIGVFPQTDIHRKNAEMGYWLAEPYWGQGIMVQAIGLIVDYAFKTFDINRIFARPFGTNKASQRVLEKSGFILEATFNSALFKSGEYKDEFIYALRKGEQNNMMHLLSESASWLATSEFVTPDGMISKATGKSIITVHENEITNESWAQTGYIKRQNNYRIKPVSFFEYHFESINPELGNQIGKFTIDRNTIYSRFNIESTELNGFEIIRREGNTCYANGALYDKNVLINTWTAIMTKEE